MTRNNASPHPWRLVEVWGDTVDQRHLGWSIAIGIVISLASFLAANHVLAGLVSRPELARAYAMLAGLGGCVLAGVVCGLVFKPKRVVVEGRDVDPTWRLEVLARLAEEHGGLGNVADLPESAVREMKALEIYDLFASHRPAARLADDAVAQARRPATVPAPRVARAVGGVGSVGAAGAAGAGRGSR